MKVLTAKRILKYGAMGTVGLAAGGYYGGFASAPVGEKHESGKTIAKIAAGIGIATTAGFLARKYIGRGIVGAAKEVGRTAKSDAKVIFRRINGRIVPIRGKP